MNLSLVPSQRLSLRVLFVESVLVRSAGLLESLKYQRGVTLVKDLAEGKEYRSLLDFIAALMVPSLVPHMDAFYQGEGPNLDSGFSTEYVKCLDQTLAVVIQHLARAWAVLKEQGIKTKEERLALAIVEVVELRTLFRPADPYRVLDNRSTDVV